MTRKRLNKCCHQKKEKFPSCCFLVEKLSLLIVSADVPLHIQQGRHAKHKAAPGMKNSKQSVKNGEAKCALGSTPSSLLFTFVSERESFCSAVSARPARTAVCLFLCWYLLLIASYFIGRSTGHGYLANTSFASLLKKRRRRATHHFCFQGPRSVRSLEPGLRVGERKRNTPCNIDCFLSTPYHWYIRGWSALIFLPTRAL